MKNKKLLYIILTIITFFSYNLTVNAAQELTCVYDKNDDTFDNEYNKKIVLIQTKTGAKELYVNNYNYDIDGFGWDKISNGVAEIFDWTASEGLKIREENKELTSCPKFYNSSIEKIGWEIDRDPTKTYIQFIIDFELDQYRKINESQSLKKVKRPDINKVKELTCIYKGTTNIALLQYSNGKKEIYKNRTEPTVESFWEKVNNNLSFKIDSVHANSNQNLSACPKYINVPNAVNSKSSDGLEIMLADSSGWFDSDIKLVETESQTFKPLNYLIAQPQYDNNSSWLMDLNGNYTGSCKYERIVETNNSNEKHIIQLNIGKGKILITEYDPAKGMNYSANTSVVFSDGDVFSHMIHYNYSFKIDYSQDTYEQFLGLFGYNCPAALSISRKDESQLMPATNPPQSMHTNETTLLKDSTKGDIYYISDVRGTNPETGKNLTLDGIHTPIINLNPNIETCEQLLGEDIIRYINVVWNIIKFGIPILLIGLGTLDFVQAIFSGKEDGMKKAQSKFIKRIIISVVIFLVPTLLKLLLDIADGVWGDFGTDLCNLIF